MKLCIGSIIGWRKTRTKNSWLIKKTFAPQFLIIGSFIFFCFYYLWLLRWKDRSLIKCLLLSMQKSLGFISITWEWGEKEELATGKLLSLITQHLKSKWWVIVYVLRLQWMPEAHASYITTIHLLLFSVFAIKSVFLNVHYLQNLF